MQKLNKGEVCLSTRTLKSIEDNDYAIWFLLIRIEVSNVTPKMNWHGLIYIEK